jgi:hypothetical protein
MAMQLSSTFSQFEEVVAIVGDIDFATMSGVGASAFVERAVPVMRTMSAAIDAASARAVEANQHTMQGFPDGAAFVASKLGVSLKDGRRLLAMQKSLAALPEVSSAVRSGCLSTEKASVIIKGADGKSDVARDLLANAHRPVEELELLVQKLRAQSGRTKQRRNSQYINMRKDGDMIKGNFGILASKAPWMGRWMKIEQEAIRKNRKRADPLPDTAAAAEAFSEMVSKSGGDVTNVVVHHIDVPLCGVGEPSCELVGVGPVPQAVVDEIKANAILNVVLTVDDKLTRYYENVKPDRDRPLPDPIKRAVKANAYDTCEIDGCTQPAIDVDHIRARSQGGDHELTNLQAICKMHHDAKTKIEAPWTIPKIYGRNRERMIIPEITIEDLPEEKLFPDTG